MAQTRASGKIAAANQDQDATSPQALTDIQSNHLSSTEQLIIKTRPKPKPVNIPPPRSGLNAADETQHQRPKRGRSGSDTDIERMEATEPTCTHQPPTKRSKKADVASPVKHGAGSFRLKLIPPRSPLPVRINRVVNPGAPDQKRGRRTSASVTAAMQRKEHLKSELEKMERDKIRMLAEMEASEEEEQRQEERMVIRDVTDLAESYPDIEGEPDNDHVMADSEEDIEKTEYAVAPVDELEGPIKMVSPRQEQKTMFFTDGFSSRKRKPPSPRAILVWQLTRKK
jgi:hypothetical protein